jgi:peptide-methionine (R)-S-oxide reductase
MKRPSMLWIAVCAVTLTAVALACGPGARTPGGTLQAAEAGAPAAPGPATAAGTGKKPAPADVIVPVVKTADEWRKILTPEQFHIMREAGTEIAFTGKYWNNHARGTYVCAACDLPLFSSQTKFDSGTGWPSFWQPIARDHLVESPDNYMGRTYSELKCARCGGHLGHVFDDGPAPTGLRYCIDSAALKFVPASKS